MNLSSNHSASVNPQALCRDVSGHHSNGCVFCICQQYLPAIENRIYINQCPGRLYWGGSAMGDGPLPSAGRAFSGEDRIEKSNGGCILRARSEENTSELLSRGQLE